MLISMEEDTLLVWRNTFYLDSLDINDLTLPGSTWLYLALPGSTETRLNSDPLLLLSLVPEVILVAMY